MIDALDHSIQREAARILREDLVDVVIGFKAGSVPMKAQPAFVRSDEAARCLVRSGFGDTNLALYVGRRPRSERIGLICRGCESRAVRVLVSEQQHARELIYLIGIPCNGIIDRSRIELEAGPEVLSARETGTEVVAATRVGEYRFRRSDVLHDACRQCRYPDPVGIDVMVGETTREDRIEPARTESEAFDLLSADERHGEFAGQAERCIRCYACRQACPMCYCTQCFVDGTTPRWTESTVSPAGVQAWHIMRAFHQTGRCVECGACERACPMDIKMMYLTNKLNLHMERSYGFVPGIDEHQTPPFAAFSLDDSDRFER